ncbi:MAG: sensor histidine kinase [Wenzhouxiangella sp.]
MPPNDNDHVNSLVRLQYELAMRIGQHLQLTPMLRHFFPQALKSLGCRAAHVWLSDEPGQPARHRFSYPARDTLVWDREPRFLAAARTLQQAAAEPRALALDSQHHLLLLPLEPIGFCVLIRQGSSIDPMTVKALKPIFDRLANACRASLRHEKIEQVQARASRNEQRLRTVLETIGEVIFQVDSDGRISFINPAWEPLTGYTMGESIDRPLADFLDAASRPALLQLLARAAGQPEAISRDLHLKTATGQLRDIVIRFQPRDAALEQDGERDDNTDIGSRWYDRALSDPHHLTGTLIDVTDIRRAERMKRDFIATVSHELRTPLTSIIGAIGLLHGHSGGQLDPQASRLVDIAEKNSQRLRTLIDDLLDMEKLLIGKLSMQSEAFDVVPSIDRMLEEHAPLLSQKGLAVTVDYNSPLPSAQGDAARFEQVLSNLLSNAVKFSPDNGQVVIRCACQASQLRTEVIDQGPGIDDDFLSDLFRPFTQSESSDARLRGGTGLGLAISRALVEQMGGRIGVQSVPGQGATFWFELPTAAIDESSSKFAIR